MTRCEWAALPVIRLYIHGLHVGATDILVFGMIQAKLIALGSSVAEVQCGELLGKWFARMHKATQCVVEGLEFRSIVEKVESWVVVERKEESEESKEEAVEKVDMKELERKAGVLYEHVSYTDLPLPDIDWESLSTLLKPQRHDANNTKKMDQLHSMLGGVRTCVTHLRTQSQRVRIVDFCSGAGHLGIFLAHHFPDCEVILVETKWGSLRYAKERIAALGLTNVTLCLCHMGQFCGEFELGVSLHACGSATDAVIQQCVRNNAAIVSSPCCYGKIVNLSYVQYPQSKLFCREFGSFAEFMEVARLADHEKENEIYMKCVDIDRLEGLREKGYQFLSIQKLKPLTCSPKNNLLVAHR